VRERIRRSLRTWLIAPSVACAALAAAQTECPTCVPQLEPSLAGTWSSTLTAAAEPGWALDDYFCFAACTDAARAHAQRLLGSAETAHHAALELYARGVAANLGSVKRLSRAAGDEARPSPLPGFSCAPQGYAAQVVSPLPLEIVVGRDRALLRYEEFAVERTIWLAAQNRHGMSSSFGESKGRFEGGALVVETAVIPAGRLSDWLGGFAHSDDLRAIERYSVSADGRWLELELTLEDPATLYEPLVVTKRWVRAPHARIAQHRCDVMSGGLSGVFAEYLDPRVIDARRR
jgi:hypothetical protein